MEPRTVIQTYFTESEAKGTKPSLKDFIAAHVNFVAQNTAPEEDAEAKWTTIFNDIAVANNVTVKRTRKQPAWELVSHRSGQQGTSTKRIPHVVSSSLSNSGLSEPKGAKRTKSPSGAKSGSHLMTERMMHEYEAAYKDLDNTKKWKIPGDKYVEDILFEFGQRCTHEHLAHSFIINMSDPQIEKLFTPEQFKIITDAGTTAFPPLQDGVKSIFHDCSEIINTILDEGDPDAPRTKEQEERIIESLWKKLTSYGFFHPKLHFEEDWLQRSLLDILNWYRFNTLDLFADHPSEMDYIVQIWSILDKCFGDIRVQTRRARVAAAVCKNSGLDVTDMSTVEKKDHATRPDLIFLHNNLEFGAGEVGMEDLAVGEKECVDTQLHCTKKLKHMANLIAQKCGNKESLLRDIRLVAYNQSCLRMSVSVLDCPGGYVCRVFSSSNYEVFRLPSLMQNGLLPILKLGLMTKEIVRQSTATVDRFRRRRADGDPELDTKKDEDPSDKVILLPPVARTSEKRQKVA